MLQLADLVANYPPSDLPDIQTIISSKREFIEMAGFPDEPPPQPGTGQRYTNQEFLRRYMIPYDKILVIWETGTGKTCGVVAVAEHYRQVYLQDPQNAPIRRAYFLTHGPGLKEDLKLQIACRCTAGDYLTPLVVESTREATRKANLSREIGKWYTIETYTIFAKQLEKLSDEAIKQQYSNGLFFVDEVHNINIAVKSGIKASTKQLIYNQFWRLFHLADNIKIILATATPMINEAKEIAPLMNLILPDGPNDNLPFGSNQLPLDLDYNQVSLDQLEPYFRGKISYVRALETGIDLVNQGVPLEITFETSEGPQTSVFYADTSVMGEVQLEAYRRAQQIKSGVFNNERQVANFVFPDGTWGGTFPRLAKQSEATTDPTTYGLGKYVISTSPDNYQATDELLEAITGLDNLAVYSSKAAQTIQEILNGTLGTVFVYNDFVFGSGTIVYSLSFEANGFERYKGNKSAFESTRGGGLPPLCSNEPNSKRITLKPQGYVYPDGYVQPYRYAMITSETSAANTSRILELFNSPENLHGDYLKVLLGSEVAREGINLSHGTQVHLITGWWNRSANYQAISRIVRATSHVPLLNELREQIEASGGDPNEAVIPVEVHQHVALPEPEDYDNSVDVLMYRLSEVKNYNIQRMMKFLRQAAIDCWINYDRNVKPDESFTCAGQFPRRVDMETFDVYYIEPTLQQAASRIVELFQEKFSYSRAELYALLDDFRKVEIDRALTQLFYRKQPIYDRYGYVGYLREDNDRFYLQREFSPEQSPSQALQIYTSNLIASRQIPLSEYLNWLDADQQNSIEESLMNLPPDDPNFEILIDQLKLDSQIDLLENAIYTYVMSQPTPMIHRIIDYYHNYLYIFIEPFETLAILQARTTAKKKGPGRPPKEKGKPRAVRASPQEISNLLESNQENVKQITIGDMAASLESPDSELVFLHTLYSAAPGRVAYNVSTRFSNVGDKIRVFKPNEGVGWRYAKKVEVSVYSVIIADIKEEIISNFEQYDIYGTILQDGKFRIRDKTRQQSRNKQGKEELDKRYGRRGRICTNIDKAILIDILWQVGAPAPNVKPNITASNQRLIQDLRNDKIIRYDEDVSNWSRKKLEYFTRWNVYHRPKICQELKEYFRQTGRLFEI